MERITLVTWGLALAVLLAASCAAGPAPNAGNIAAAVPPVATTAERRAVSRAREEARRAAVAAARDALRLRRSVAAQRGQGAGAAAAPLAAAAAGPLAVTAAAVPLAAAAAAASTAAVAAPVAPVAAPPGGGVTQVQLASLGATPPPPIRLTVPAAAPTRGAAAAAPPKAPPKAAPKAAPAARPASAAARPAAAAATATVQAQAWQAPPPGTAFQYQLSQPYRHPRDYLPGVTAYAVDLFDTDERDVRSLAAAGGYPICYFSSSYEDWRPDKGSFPPSALGKAMDGWAGERWVDTRDAGVRAVARRRMELCRDKGFDAVDVDNVQTESNDTGFPLTPGDQLSFIRFLAATAHSLGLAFSLKNNAGQAAQLVAASDFAINESCSQYNECDDYAPFKAAGKQVFQVEYTDASFKKACATAAQYGTTPIRKELDLKAAPRTACPGAA